MRLRLIVVSICALLAALVAAATPAAADTESGGIVLSHQFPDFPGRAVYDYSPTVVQTGNTQHYYWCGYGPRVSANGAATDNIYYRSRDVATDTWSDPVDVFGPTADPAAWDSRFICNPAVITGNFTFDGHLYQIALYYVATTQSTGTTNKIGVAYSNDWINFVRDPDPVVLPSCQTGYGVGQPTLYNTDGGSALTIFYFDIRASCGEDNQYQVATSTDGRNFGAPQPVAVNGFPEGSIPSNASFGYDPGTDTWYAAAEFSRQTTRPNEKGDSYAFGLYRIPASSLLSGAAPWTLLTTVDTNSTGYEVNLIPALTRDGVGNVDIPGLYPSLQMSFAVADPRPAADADSTDDAENDARANWDIAQVTWHPGHPLLRLRQYYSTDLDRAEATTGWVDTSTFTPFQRARLLGGLYEAPTPDATTPLYGCRSGTGYSYSVSTDSTCGGAKVLGIDGYGYAADQPGAGRIPLYRCDAATYHFLSNHKACAGYANQGIVAYAHRLPSQ